MQYGFAGLDCQQFYIDDIKNAIEIKYQYIISEKTIIMFIYFLAASQYTDEMSNFHLKNVQFQMACITFVKKSINERKISVKYIKKLALSSSHALEMIPSHLRGSPC